MTFDVGSAPKVLRKKEIWEKQSGAKCDWPAEEEGVADEEGRDVIVYTELVNFYVPLVSLGKYFIPSTPKHSEVYELKGSMKVPLLSLPLDL